MTEQEKQEKVISALAILRTWVAVNPDYGIGLSVTDCRKAVKWLDDALELLKAQEPVEPVVDKSISTGESDDPWGRLFFCGACGRRINEKYNPDEDDKYCKHCGRPVKWDD